MYVSNNYLFRTTRSCNGGKNQIWAPIPPAANVTQPYSYVGQLLTNENLCLDGKEGKGGKLRANTCDGSPTQKWILKQVGSYFSMQIAGTNFCVDVYGRSLKPGSTVGVRRERKKVCFYRFLTYFEKIWDCNNGNNQLWNVDSNKALVNLNSGLCMDLAGTGIHPPGIAPSQLLSLPPHVFFNHSLTLYN